MLDRLRGALASYFKTFMFTPDEHGKALVTLHVNVWSFVKYIDVLQVKVGKGGIILKAKPDAEKRWKKLLPHKEGATQSVQACKL